MSKLVIKPLTPGRWPPYEALVGPNGASSGCWCMWWRLPRTEYEAGRGPINKARFKRLVKKGPPPGLLAFDGGEALGWCALCPRSKLPGLDRSHQLARIDDKPVWSIGCFFVKRAARGRGISGVLIDAAIDYAKKKGAPALEAYPWDINEKKSPPAIYTGIASVFERAGFTVAARRAPHRPVMRYTY
jgi:GNAT superfamily N-acetyltransferase